MWDSIINLMNSTTEKKSARNDPPFESSGRTSTGGKGDKLLTGSKSRQGKSLFTLSRKSKNSERIGDYIGLDDHVDPISIVGQDGQQDIITKVDDINLNQELDTINSVPCEMRVEKRKTVLPNFLLEIIFKLLDFPSLCKARLVCTSWNHLISYYFLPHSAVLHYNYVPTCRSDKFWVDRFRKGKISTNQLGQWREIRVHQNRGMPNETLWTTGNKLKKIKLLRSSSPKPTPSLAPMSAYNLKNFKKGRKSSLSGLVPYVTTLSIHETNVTYDDLVNSFMNCLINVRHLEIVENDFAGMQWRYGSNFRDISTKNGPNFIFGRNIWRNGKKNLANLHSLKIQLYERVAMLVYIRLIYKSMSMAHGGKLTELNLDFSRATYLIPVSIITGEVFEKRFHEIFRAVRKILVLNANTLRILRLIFIPRIDLDALLVLYEDQVEPFSVFLSVIDEFEYEPAELYTERNWSNYDLREIELSFPIINFKQGAVKNAIFQRFLSSQKNLKNLKLGRVLWDLNLQNEFKNGLLSNRKDASSFELEMHVYIKDFDRPTFPLPEYVTEIEFHTFWMLSFNLTSLEQRQGEVMGRGRGGRGQNPPPFLGQNLNNPRNQVQIQNPPRHHRHHHHHHRHQNKLYWDMLYKRPYQIKLLRFINSKYNQQFFSFNIDDILARFPHLTQLELLDNSVSIIILRQGVGASTTEAKSIVSPENFVSILRNLPELFSLKLSNLFRLSDENLTGISSEAKGRINRTGIYLPRRDADFVKNSPFEYAKNLKYLELRNLSENVTDISILFGFQLIPKLDKICFHGTQQITEWGLSALKNHYKSNPEFRVYCRENLLENFEQDFP